MAQRLIPWFALAVLAIHLVVLQALSALWQPPSRLKAMNKVFFTRELHAEAAPAPVPVLKQKVANGGVHKVFIAPELGATPIPSVPQTDSLTSSIASADIAAAEAFAAHANATAASAASPAASEPATQAAVDESAAATANTAAASKPENPSPAASELAGAAAHPASAPASASNPTSVASAPRSGATPPDSWPADTRLSYVLDGYYRGPMTGSAHVQWQRDGARYQVRVDLVVAALNLFTMTSQGRVVDQDLQPEAYEEKRLGAKVLQLAFDGRDIRLYDGKTTEQPPLAQDTASQFVELGHRFATGRETLAVGNTVRMWLARPSAVAQWTYDVVSRDRLSSRSLGEFDAYHLKPRPLDKPTGPVTAEMWFAPALQYLPVRIRINLNADAWVDLMISRIEQADPAAKAGATSESTPAQLGPTPMPSRSR